MLEKLYTFAYKLTCKVASICGIIQLLQVVITTKNFLYINFYGLDDGRNIK